MSTLHTFLVGAMAFTAAIGAGCSNASLAGKLGNGKSAKDNGAPTAAPASAPAPGATPGGSEANNQSESQQADKPTEVAGAFLTCDAAPEYAPTAQGAAYGCAFTNEKHEKVESPSGIQVNAIHKDGSQATLTATPASDRSRWHVVFFEPAATASAISKVTAAATVASKPVNASSPLKDPDAAKLVDPKFPPCADPTEYQTGTGCKATSTVNEWQVPGVAIMYSFAGKACADAGNPADASCRGDADFASRTFIGADFRAFTKDVQAPHVVKLTAMQHGSTTGEVVLAADSDVPNKVNQGYAPLVLDEFLVFEEGAPGTLPIYHWNAAGSPLHYYDMQCTCDGAADSRTDCATMFAGMTCSKVGANGLPP